MTDTDLDAIPACPKPRLPAWPRMVAAIVLTTACGIGIFALLMAIRPEAGLISFSFLLLLPAALGALITYLADPWGDRPGVRPAAVTLWFVFGVFAVSLLILREGFICVLILAPLWSVSAFIGSYLVWRRQGQGGRTYCLGLLAAPLMVMPVEPLIPLPEAEHVVSRAIVIAAPPATIWPLAQGIPDVRSGEGRWNLTQDLVGVPRPLGARLTGAGPGAVRHALWQRNIRFREVITEWQPGQQIGWRFEFDDPAGWDFTDPHLRPNSPYLTITTGGYRIEPLGGNKTRLVLHTRYRARTPVNAYAAWWGELFLGDLEDNLLATIKARAEMVAGASVSGRGTERKGGQDR